MTTTTTSRSTTTPTSRLVAPAAVVALVTSAAFTALGVFGDGTDGADHGAGGFLVVLAVSAVAVGILFGLVVPRALAGTRSAAVGLGLSIAGLLLVLVFWSGLTPPLAIAGMLLGAHARRTGQRAGAGGTAVAIGALALLGYVAVYVSDWMATNNIAGM